MERDALWDTIQEEVRDGFDNPDLMLTKVAVIVETLDSKTERSMTRISFDRSGNRLMPWDEGGLLSRALADCLNERRGHTP